MIEIKCLRFTSAKPRVAQPHRLPPIMRVILGTMVLLLGACSISPPGEDRQGIRLKASASAVLSAIIKYREVNGQVPSKLEDLIPSFLAGLPAKPQLDYQPMTGILMFDYRPTWAIGQSSCAASVFEQNWRCHGYS
jgi:hypothetical protein